MDLDDKRRVWNCSDKCSKITKWVNYRRLYCGSAHTCEWAPWGQGQAGQLLREQALETVSLASRHGWPLLVHWPWKND